MTISEDLSHLHHVKILLHLARVDLKRVHIESGDARKAISYAEKEVRELWGILLAEYGEEYWQLDPLRHVLRTEWVAP